VKLVLRKDSEVLPL